MRDRSLATWFFLVLGGLLALNAILCSPDPQGIYNALHPSSGLDIRRFYTCSWCLRVGQDVYGDAFRAISQQMFGYVQPDHENYHPPGFYFWMQLLTWTTPPNIVRVFNGVSSLVFWAGLNSLVWTLFEQRAPRLFGVFLSLAILLCPLAISNLYLGQVALLVCGLLALTYVFSRRNAQVAAGFCLALAIDAKIYPALLLGCFLRPLRKRALLACLGLLLLTNLGGVLCGGLGQLSGFFFEAVHVPVKPGIRSESIPSVLARLQPGWAAGAYALSSLAMVLSALLCLRSGTRPHHKTYLYCLAILSFQVWAPFCWTYQRFLNLVPWLLSCSEVRREMKAGWLLPAVLTLSLMLEGDLVWNPTLNLVHRFYAEWGLSLPLNLLAWALALHLSFGPDEDEA